MKHIVIIGNGIAGITAARHIRKLSDHRITVISSETDYFFSRTALMYVYMGHMKFEHTQPYENSFWKKNRIELLNDRVEKIDPGKRALDLRKSGTFTFDTLIIATGSKPNMFGWPGQDLKGVQGLYSKQDLDLLETHAPDNQTCKRAVIVGGGLIGIELAEMLSSRNIPVTFLVRESGFWNNVLPEGESNMITRHIREHHIDLRLDTSLKEILSDSQGKVRAVVTDTGEEIPADLCGITAGVRPNIDFLQGSGIETDRGILVNDRLETNIPGIYAIGDCAQLRAPKKGRRPIEAVWYAGRMMGETLAYHLCKKPTTYNPGPWFNSAKFFDIEYQTYGLVAPETSENEQHLYWEDIKAKRAVNIAYDPESELFLGINTLGLRLSHRHFDQWLREKASVAVVLSNLEQAGFDPEFYPDFIREIKTQLTQLLKTT
ncbi:NAD(P)/FAD-dependent oxidoreductase [Robertkochia sediminum]|uniref:NAD(P)/FAD-dependent oxidoreductase n=1 Tax=Robertkochia sediminum TaxID=2785326 RepID=UPI0019325C19|nr:FAD/NAD(P)-binding oxidoreductase [Robertkochia sediminum]MBL7473059.1 NAD(P)/FAD-dependent oxidoreductase [Robertkochia sediminum]